MDSSIPYKFSKTFQDELALVILVTAVWFFLPVLSVIPLSVILFKVKLKDSQQVFLLFLIAVSFGLVGYTAKSVGVEETDIARYYNQYKIVAEVKGFADFVLLFLIEDGTSLLFQLVTLGMAKTFPSNPQLLPLFWVTFSYFFTFLTIREGVYFLSGRYSKLYVVVIAVALFGIITFFTVTEIIKQVSSVSLFAYALMLKLNKKRGGVLCLVLSVLIHLSSLLLVPVFISFNKKKVFSYLPLIFLVCLALSFLNFNVVIATLYSVVIGTDSGIKARLEYYKDIDTWSISFRFLMIFVIYILQIGLVYIDYHVETDLQLKEKKKKLVTLQTLAFLFLLINRSNVHNFIRYTFCFFPFYSLVYLQLFYSRIKKKELVLLLFFIAAFYIFSNIKLLTSQTNIGGPYDNSYMDNDGVQILFSNVYLFLKFKVNA
jgi:hypothetical protein